MQRVSARSENFQAAGLGLQAALHLVARHPDSWETITKTQLNGATTGLQLGAELLERGANGRLTVGEFLLRMYGIGETVMPRICEAADVDPAVTLMSLTWKHRQALIDVLRAAAGETRQGKPRDNEQDTGPAPRRPAAAAAPDPEPTVALSGEELAERLAAMIATWPGRWIVITDIDSGAVGPAPRLDMLAVRIPDGFRVGFVAGPDLQAMSEPANGWAAAQVVSQLYVITDDDPGLQGAGVIAPGADGTLIHRAAAPVLPAAQTFPRVLLEELLAWERAREVDDSLRGGIYEILGAFWSASR